MSNSKDMVKVVYAALEEKQGKDISIMDIGGVSVIADYFVIAQHGYELRRREGVTNSGWILLDYNDIIVHIFDKEQRLFYDLERIWSDGKKIVSVDEL